MKRKLKIQLIWNPALMLKAQHTIRLSMLKHQKNKHFLKE